MAKTREEFRTYLEEQATQFMQDTLDGKINASALDDIYARERKYWEKEYVVIYSYAKLFSFRQGRMGPENAVAPEEHFYLTRQVPDLEKLENVMLGYARIIRFDHKECDDCRRDGDNYGCRGEYENFLTHEDAVQAFVFFYLRTKDVAAAAEQFLKTLMGVIKKFHNQCNIDLYDYEDALFDQIYKMYEKT